MKRLYFPILLVVVFTASSAGAGAGITYHGRLLKPDGSPVTASSVTFKVQIRTPGSENCLLYEEQQTKDLSASKGVFALTINDGTATVVNTEPFLLDRAFQNRGTFTFAGGKCTSGGTYTPNPTDGRKLVVEFNDGSFAGFEQMPAQNVNYVPMAIESMTVGGFNASSLLRVVDGSGAPSVVAPLTQTQHNALLDLVNGSGSIVSGQIPAGAVTDAKIDTVSGSKVTGNIAGNAAGFTGSLAGDVTGSQSATTVTKIQGRAVDTAAPTNGQALVWSAGNSRWEPATVSGGGGGAVNSVTGTSPVTVNNTDPANPVVGVNASVTSTNNSLVQRDGAGAIQSAGANFGSLQVNNGSSTITLGTPAAFTSYVLKLPSGPGTNGQILTSNGTDMIWSTPTADANKVDKSGDTMSGSLTLSSGSLVAPANGLAIGTNQLVASGGRVGVGAAAPQAQLHVNTNTNAIPGSLGGGFPDTGIAVSAVNGQNTSIEQYSFGGGTSFRLHTSRGTAAAPLYPASTTGLGNIAARGWDENAGNWATGAIVAFGAETNWSAADRSSYIRFQTTSGTTLSEKVRISSVGNVGIGTTTPLTQLHVHKDQNLSSGIYVSNTHGGNEARATVAAATSLTASLSMNALGAGFVGGAGWEPDTGLLLSDAGLERMNILTARTDAPISLYPGGVQTLTATPDGRVGIGTATPTERLEVNGKVKATQLCLGADCKSAWPSGAGSITVQSQSSSFSVATGDAGKVFVMTAQMTVTLPDAAVAGAGFNVILKSAVNGYIYVKTTSGDMIDGTDQAILATYKNAQLVSDGTAYHVIGGEVIRPAAGAKRIFASSVTYSGNLGGLAGADTKCQTLATAAGLPGTYKAWLSATGTNANARLTQSSGGYYKISGSSLVTVATDWASFTSGTLNASINTNEYGNSVTGQVWTGSTATGILNGSTCTNWTVSGLGTNGYSGQTGSTGNTWSETGNATCDTLQRLFCLQQ